MLTEILMESLMSMDEDVLDSVLESCNEEELEIINDAIESITVMTSKDRDDFDTIERIQRQARSKGWGNVDKKDRDKFVKIMSTTNNLSVLKKAKQLGEKEAANDSKVRNALGAFGASAAGAAIGYTAGGINALKHSGDLDEIKGEKYEYAKRLRDNKKEIADSLKEYGRGSVEDWQEYIDEMSEDSSSAKVLKAMGLKPGMTVNNSNVNSVAKKFAAKMPKMAAAADTFPENPKTGDYSLTRTKGIINSALDKFDRMNVDDTEYAAKSITGGAIGGAVLGAGAREAIKLAKNKLRFAKDKKAVMAQGDKMHPDEQWKLNRKINELKGKK